MLQVIYANDIMDRNVNFDLIIFTDNTTIIASCASAFLGVCIHVGR